MNWEQLYSNYWRYRSIISEAQSRGLTPEQARVLVQKEQRLEQSRQQAEQQRQQAEQAEQRRQQEELRRQQMSIPRPLPSVDVASYQQFLEKNPSMPKGFMSGVFSIPSYAGIKSQLDKIYKEGGGSALAAFANKQYNRDQRLGFAVGEYRKHLEAQTKAEKLRLRNIAARKSGGKLQPAYGPNYGGVATFPQPPAPNYSIGQQRFGSQQSAAARGFYQTPYAYQNL